MNDQTRPTVRAHVVVVWIAYAAVALGMFATYARFPVSDFYHVSKDGLAGGASRMLVFTNFSASFTAIALLGIGLTHLLPSVSGRATLFTGGAGAVSFVLCALTAHPAVVKQSDLDARPINILPAIGVAMAVGITILALRVSSMSYRPAVDWRDRLALGLAVSLGLVGLPWVLADLGFYIGDVPLLGSLFASTQIYAGETLRAVHLGHHHGMDGLLFALSALVLARVVRAPRTGLLSRIMPVYLAFMLAYGVANMLNDFWGEQIVKRGWSEYTFPNFLRPELSQGWGMVVLGATVAWVILFRAPGTAPHVEGEASGLPVASRAAAA